MRMPMQGSQSLKNQPSISQFTDAKQIPTEDIGTSTEDTVEFSKAHTQTKHNTRKTCTYRKHTNKHRRPSIQVRAHIKALIKLTKHQMRRRKNKHRRPSIQLQKALIKLTRQQTKAQHHNYSPQQYIRRIIPKVKSPYAMRTLWSIYQEKRTYSWDLSSKEK